jgi:2-haloacid dehalogenase
MAAALTEGRPIGSPTARSGQGQFMTVIVFDVNETLLDLGGLDEPFAEVFGDRGGEVKRLWFARLLHTSTVMTTIGLWQDFAEIGKSVLADVGRRLDLPVTGPQIDEIVGTMRSLDAHPDVKPGLERLADAGVPMVALTNSGQDSAEAQLAHAGIDTYFDRILSVEGLMRFKPDPMVYDHCRETLDVLDDQLVMVAAHDWDCAGALVAGWRAAYVDRPGQAYNALLRAPTWQVADIGELADVLTADGTLTQ